MNVYELVEALDGEIVNNKAMVRVDGVWTVVGCILDDALTLTEDGLLLAESTVAKPKKKGKAKADPVDAGIVPEGDA